MTRRFGIGLMMAVLAGGAIFLAVTFVPGCGRKNGADSKKMKVAIFNFPGYMPIRLAEKKQFFDGVDVEIVKIEDTTARRAALSSGSVDGSVDIVDSFICGRASGIPATVVLKIDDSMGADGIVSKKEIKSIRDLRSKSVAFAKDQPSHFFLVALLEREGMTMRDIVAKPMSNADEAGTAFLSDQVDAAVTWEPYLTKAKGKPNGHILASSKETPGLIVDVFTVHENYLKDKPDNVTAFLKGWFKAVEFWKENPAEANKIMAEAMDVSVDEFVEQVSGLKYGDLAENRLFFRKGADGLSPFLRLVGQANKVWIQEGVIKAPVDPASIDSSSHVLGIQ
jgi:NitT/TauT family transport system substrate-binding protein